MSQLMSVMKGEFVRGHQLMLFVQDDYEQFLEFIKVEREDTKIEELNR